MKMRHLVALIVLVCATLLSSHPALAQFSQEGPKLAGTGAVGIAGQGLSVSLSADGNTAIVGGPADNSYAGAAWVWTRSGAVWIQQGTKLVGSGAVGTAYQGYSVSLSADGNTAIVGGYLDNGGAGAAWVWTRSGGVWTQHGKLVGSGALGTAYRGYSVSLSADGNTAIVGGPKDSSNAGAAWVFTRSAGVWTQQGTKLVGSGAVGAANQALSVSLSADGNTAIVGGDYDNSQAGAAWVWTRSAGVWTQQGTKLVGSGAVGIADQGWSVSLSADGNTAIVGGHSDNGYAGAAWVWTRSGGVWTQQGAKLVGSGAVGNASQGASVSLSADGNTAIVGGDNDNNIHGGTNPASGAAWVWTRSAGVWTQLGTKLVGSGAVGLAGQASSVSLSADGNTAIVGGPADNSLAGAAWVFAASAATSTPPIVTTTAANAVAQTSATLNGTINPNGKSTTGYLQWGLTSPSYGNTTTSHAMGSGTSAVALSQGLTSLACNTLYHFRAVGTNSDGTTNGSDLTFTTSACDAPAVPPRRRVVRH
jgi:FG-GAP repeat